MKPAWDKLADTYAESDLVTIADVDCTAKGQPLCQKYGVRGYPTIKYFTFDVDEQGEKYQGGRDFEVLQKFVDNTFKPGCNFNSHENCDEDSITLLKSVKNASLEKLKSLAEAKQKEMQELKEERNKAGVVHQAKLEASETGEDTIREEIKIVTQLAEL